LTSRPIISIAALVLVAGCSRSGADANRSGAKFVPGARVGIDAVPDVRLFENHSDSLIAWRVAGVRDRILVHVDGHADLDWLPDVTIARLAAASPEELAALELHPYAIDGKTHERFAIWNFVYPAARLGLVREFVWVVPDGTISDPQSADELVRKLIFGKMQMIALDDARTLRLEGRIIRGTILGLPITICELDDLPAFDEPVLLDLDLDFLTTRSATSQEVGAEPSATPEALVARLRARGIRSDLATVSYSTIGGFLPPAFRWLGPAMVAALKGAPDAEMDRWRRRARADVALTGVGRPAALAALRALATAQPDDGSLWYALSLAEAATGHAAAAEAASAKAVAADPLLADAQLFEADALWLNQRYAEALPLYAGYRRTHLPGRYRAYALRREASCLARTGRTDEAIAALRQVIAIAPDHADTRLDLGVLLRERGDLDGAIAQLLEARRRLPDLAAYAMALGTTYAMQDRIGEAIDALEAAVALRPSWSQAQLNLGLLLAQAGRPVDAAAHLNAALTLEPGDQEVARLLARLRRQGITTSEVVAHP